ncbi:MAG: hypothetical protein CM1200mP1_05180 [Candidatus Neomarinimicrobiota bacterium]|nr:MAG: hypothetical protein CM1200mP1_05180 [Candidatus Neomarinimicrobiota bacterium]
MKIHRWLSFLHFAGMMAIPILGKNISTSTNRLAAISTHQDVQLLLWAVGLSGL